MGRYEANPQKWQDLTMNVCISRIHNLKYKILMY